MKLHGAGTDSANGSGPPIDDPLDPGDEDLDEEEYDYSSLFDAPSYSEFIKTPPNSKAKHYEKRVASMMKAGLVMSLNHSQWPDAATFLKHGPGFAKAAGNLAAEDARTAQIIEMITAPDSPYIMFGLVAVTMISQLVRNHQPEIREAGLSWKQRRAERKHLKVTQGKVETPPVVIKLGKWRIKLPFRFRVKLPRFRHIFSAFLAPTQKPDAIAAEVFSDEKVIRALHQMGLFPRPEKTDAA